MRKLLSLAVLAVLVTANGARSAEEKIRVLIIDGQNNHDWRSTTPVLKKELEESGRFTVEVATTAQKPTLPAEPKSDSDAELTAYKAGLAKYADDFAAYKH